MRAWMAVVCLSGCIGTGAQAQGEWFTVTGDAADAGADTVQVDPVAVNAEGTSRTMNVRVNRSTPRVNWDRLPYRSYESLVLFDCKTRRASYLQARYYALPSWQGEPVAVADYADDPRPMALRDMDPNPTRRLLRAACPTRPG